MDDKTLVERLRDEDSYYRIQEKHWCVDAEELERQRLAAADRIEALEAENADLNRRVAEERAKLLEWLREPSEGIVDIGGKRLEELEGDWMSDNERAVGVWQAMLTAFQQENSDAD